VSEKHIRQALYTADIPDPDLLIRTSGEMRVSNFLLWQIAYTELWVTPTLWPDFGPADLYRAVADFQRRTRRFGGV
jgi:undecaprenyl diphosphate synthase